MSGSASSSSSPPTSGAANPGASPNPAPDRASALKASLLKAYQQGLQTQGRLLTPESPSASGLQDAQTKLINQITAPSSTATATTFETSNTPISPGFIENQVVYNALQRPASLEEATGYSTVGLQNNAKLNSASQKASSQVYATGSTGGLPPGVEVNTEAPPLGIRDSMEQDLRQHRGAFMAELSTYKDLSKAPLLGETEPSEAEETAATPENTVRFLGSNPLNPPEAEAAPNFLNNSQKGFPSVSTVSSQPAHAEFTTNVQTLIRLVNELPEGVTKQTGAQIIRLTMEAMGISMEEVLSEAQAAQSDMLDAVRANIKKIEEFKTVIRKLETDIKFYQGKANDLSEIIDLFILSNASAPKMPELDEDLDA
jgi:hypothetical protein